MKYDCQVKNPDGLWAFQVIGEEFKHGLYYARLQGDRTKTNSKMRRVFPWRFSSAVWTGHMNDEKYPASPILIWSWLGDDRSYIPVVHHREWNCLHWWYPHCWIDEHSEQLHQINPLSTKYDQPQATRITQVFSGNEAHNQPLLKQSINQPTDRWVNYSAIVGCWCY